MVHNYHFMLTFFVDQRVRARVVNEVAERQRKYDAGVVRSNCMHQEFVALIGRRTLRQFGEHLVT